MSDNFKGKYGVVTKRWLSVGSDKGGLFCQCFEGFEGFVVRKWVLGGGVGRGIEVIFGRRG
jgi:hypothetical protein